VKQSGLFERVRFLESRLDRLEVIILEQDALIRAQAKVLGVEKPAEYLIPEARDMVSIVQRIASDNGLTLAEIKSRSKVAAICKPRQHAFAELLDAGFSAAGIGRFFGDMDHTTVLRGAEKARARMASE
jgi:chromosomal replication initiation ATPase DnaA